MREKEGVEKEKWTARNLYLGRVFPDSEQEYKPFAHLLNFARVV